MSYHGQSPKVSRVRLSPRAADPANPAEGDMQYADGTARDEGLWVYQDGAWAQVSTGAAISVLPTLTLTPSASDPGSPAEGMFFVADGTSRAEGLWQYMNGDWVQITGLKYEEFSLKAPVTVRVASTANVTLASQVENGDVIDGITLATGDLVLLKNQTTATENGVYVVALSGAPTRHTSADTAAELNDYVAHITAGTTNANTLWYQTATLASLATNQVWASTPGDKSFVVPEGVYELRALATGAGGGGGGGGGRSSTGSGGGGGGAGGGGGGRYGEVALTVTPGETLTIKLGKNGLRGLGGTSDANNSTNGADGGVTQLLRSSTVLQQWVGGAGGGGAGGGTTDDGKSGANSAVNAGGVGGTASASGGGGGGGGGGGMASIDSSDGGSGTAAGESAGFSSGGGGGGAVNSGAAGDGGTGGISDFVTSAAAGGTSPSDGGGGGGGGASIGAAGAGGNGGSVDGANGSTGAGGGGGGGSTNSPSTGGNGGLGGSGYMRISW